MRLRPSPPYITRPIGTSSATIPPSIVIFSKTSHLFSPTINKVSEYFRFHGYARTRRLPIFSSTSSSPHLSPSSLTHIKAGSASLDSTPGNLEVIEETIEKAIYRSRFMAFMGVLGSLIGSFLCFIKGCSYVVTSFMEYSSNRGKVIMTLVEAIDVYLLGTVMLVFGMGLYELFVSNLGSEKSLSEEKNFVYKSNLFGLFTLKERPKWLDVKTVNELKTKLGHVIVMLLLIGFLEKSKKATIHTAVDLLCFSASVLLSSGSLFLLSKLNGSR